MMSNQAIKKLSTVRMDEQLFANALNIDFFVYSFGDVVYDKRQANAVSKSLCVCWVGVGRGHEQDTGGR